MTFAAPLQCDSRMCGPVLDEVLLVFEAIGAHRANFIHVQIYPALQRGESHPTRAFVDYGFRTDPWTLLVDREGIIRARFEGPAVAEEIGAALRPLV